MNEDNNNNSKKTMKLSFLSFFRCNKGRRDGLTAEKANMIARFGTADDFKTIVKRKIKEVEQQIEIKLQYSSQERLLALIVPEDQKDLFDEVEKHYKSMGYNVFYVDKTQVPEFGNSRYLFISWDL